MTLRIAINGFGRIGRCIARAIYENQERYQNVELVAINGPSSTDTHAHLLKYDSSHGRFSSEVSFSRDEVNIDGNNIKVFHERNPELLPWGDLGIDIVMECTGVFNKREDARKHIKAGAKKVILSAPAKDDVKTIIYGVNDDTMTKEDEILSIGSCTTNCLAPIAKILNDNIGIEKGLMTTIHAYTNDQNLVDNSHKKDLRRARSAALSMIPTSTGAAKAIGIVLPELKGKLDGTAIRVPTSNVSLVDLNFLSQRKTSKEEILEIFENEVVKNPKLKDILYICKDPLVSIDFNHTPYSSCFDATQTNVIGDNFVKICSWYDNEWGFSMRMLDIACLKS
jgi:glyceraldehyde 3-phosphate dehydrogenase